MKNPTLGWQSWSPPYPSWHGYPLWDYPPFNFEYQQESLKSRRPLKQPLSYWCSWYAHGTQIDETIIMQNVKLIKAYKIPLNTVLIDDGWTQWGDWLSPDPNKFKDIKATIKKIHEQKLLAGIWIAPFLSSITSSLYLNHPKWFVTHKNKSVQGFQTSPFLWLFTPHRPVLNMALPEVKNYLAKSIDQMVMDWHVDLIKLDFLYALYFDPNYKSDKAAKAHLVWLLKYIYTKYPHIITIGCGAPFDPVARLTDAIRIYKDTALPPIAPRWINKIVYRNRVKHLAHALSAANNHNLNTDPDVRILSLDSQSTTRIWDTIRPSIVGVGDDLTKLTSQQINIMKLWLKNHFSQSSFQR